MEKQHSLFRTWWQMVGYIMKNFPVGYLLLQLIVILGSLLMGLQVWGIQQVFDSVAELAGTGGNLTDLVVPLASFGLIIIARPLLQIVILHVFNVMGGKNRRIMRRLMTEKAAKLDAIVFEDPGMLDRIEKAKMGIPFSFAMVDSITTLATSIAPFFIFLGIYLHQMDARLIWVVALAIIPHIVSSLIKVPLYANLEDKSAPLRREVEAYDSFMAGRAFYKETRMLGIYGFFKEKYLNTLQLLNRETWKADRKSATIDLCLTALSSIGYFGVILLMFLSLAEGTITIGAFAAVFTTISAFIIFLVDGISMNLNYASQHGGRVVHLVDFLNLPERSGENQQLDWTGDIHLRNISFTYPNAIKPSLHNLNLHIKAGETVAIVGENGAGKSTLTKVLMGIYEPNSGEVLVSGRSSKSVSASSRYKGISAIFQKFQRYQLTLKENIELGDVQGTGNLQAAMEQAGVLYPENLETLLSREFGGVDLSGGQWQRVAIARGLYRQHDLIVLDEPTAAIDPIEESRLYEKFAEIAKDKTALIVTHRLGSAKIADRIIVMEDGQIAESGTHQELLQANGLYATMYKSQEQWYISA